MIDYRSRFRFVDQAFRRIGTRFSLNAAARFAASFEEISFAAHHLMTGVARARGVGSGRRQCKTGARGKGV
ncbi:hypothetical protein [Bradyrhizobium sp. RDM4]|uniref:hypothetical protein n=1 Tax=Bradyrhizobium sp. RDM4 TaxID=3378765 RepID=UPI0038FC616F